MINTEVEIQNDFRKMAPNNSQMAVSDSSSPCGCIKKIEKSEFALELLRRGQSENANFLSENPKFSLDPHTQKALSTILENKINNLKKIPNLIYPEGRKMPANLMRLQGIYCYDTYSENLDNLVLTHLVYQGVKCGNEEENIPQYFENFFYLKQKILNTAKKALDKLNQLRIIPKEKQARSSARANKKSKFICQLCENRCTEQFSMHYHLAVHFNVKKFKCLHPDKKKNNDMCLMMFGHSNHFKTHVRLKHNFCEMCQRYFPTQKESNDHWIYVHNKKTLTKSKNPKGLSNNAIMLAADMFNIIDETTEFLEAEFEPKKLEYEAQVKIIMAKNIINCNSKDCLSMGNKRQSSVRSKIDVEINSEGLNMQVDVATQAQPLQVLAEVHDEHSDEQPIKQPDEHPYDQSSVRSKIDEKINSEGLNILVEVATQAQPLQVMAEVRDERADEHADEQAYEHADEHADGHADEHADEHADKRADEHEDEQPDEQPDEKPDEHLSLTPSPTDSFSFVCEEIRSIDPNSSTCSNSKNQGVKRSANQGLKKSAEKKRKLLGQRCGVVIPGISKNVWSRFSY